MYNSLMKKPVFIILGPTCTGKTSLALQLCRKFNGSILSADSRQIVKYMDIGTGKVPLESGLSVEKNDGCWKVDGINIRGYDLIDPDKYYSGYDFLIYAREILNMFKVGNIFIAGGTGFYIDLVTNRAVTAHVGLDPDLRKQLENLTLEELCRELKRLNKEKFQLIDRKNKNRLVRAIEIESARKTGVITGKKSVGNEFKYKYIGLTTSRENLYSTADNWIDNIWEELLLEINKLKQMGFYNSLRLNGLVYKSAKVFLEGLVKEGEAKQRAKFDLHAYIRRQQTWFKRNSKIEWFDIESSNYRQKVEDFVELNCG